MKKIIAPTFCTLLLCSLILITLGPTIAVAQEYTRTSYPTTVIPTIDGMWTSDDEWTDGEFTWIGTDVAFTSTWDMQGSNVYTRWIVEFLTDTTDDPEDMWRFCLDGTLTFKFEIVGHTEFTLYIVPPSWSEAGGLGEDEVEWAESFSASPTSTTPHWILEFQIDKTTGDMTMDAVWNFYLEVHDESNPEFLAWPSNGNPDEPDTWGTENYSTEAIPEGLTFAVMVLLTTVSMLVGYKYFIKPKETK